MKRAGNKCQWCGATEQSSSFNGITNLQVHHLVPIEGSYRTWNVLNVPCNLIVLCSKCHGEMHHKMNLLDKKVKVKVANNQDMIFAGQRTLAGF